MTIVYRESNQLIKSVRLMEFSDDNYFLLLDVKLYPNENQENC